MNTVPDGPRAASALAGGQTPPTNPLAFGSLSLGDQVVVENGAIPPGTSLTAGNWVASADLAYVLMLQTDGNLVLYQVIGAPPSSNNTITASALWATGTTTGAMFSMQGDGNAVLYDADGNALWWTGTAGSDVTSLSVQTDGNLVLYATDGSALWATSTNHLQVWPTPCWTNIQNVVPADNGVPCVLTANSDGSVTLDALSPGSPGQMWQATPDGRLLNGLLGGIALGQIPGTSSASARQQALPSAAPQIWYWTRGQSPASLQNRASGQFLCAGTTNGTVTVQDCDTPAQWYFIPAATLDTIMSLPAADPSFPAFTDEQQGVYASINEQLAHWYQQPGLVLRNQYTNPAAPLGVYLGFLPDLDYSAFDPSVWQPVVEQLQSELAAAIGVRNLFTCYGQFHSALFDDGGALLAQLGQQAGFQEGDTTNVGGNILQVLAGVVSAVLSAQVVESDGVNPFGALASVIQSGINVGQAALKTQLSSGLFQVPFAGLWEQLSGTFEALLATINGMENAILTDWTKLQAAYALTTSSMPDNLPWPASSEVALVEAGRKGYVIAVMQMLLPAKYQIYQYTDDNGDPIDGVPDYAQYVVLAGGGSYDKYWIADANDWDVYPDQSALEQVWNSGGSEDAFFNGKDGWAFPNSLPYTFEGNDANYLVVTITNLGANPLVAMSRLIDGMNCDPAEVRVDPYESVLVKCAASSPSGIGIHVDLYDPSGGPQSDAPVGSFEAYQDWSAFEAGDVSVKNVSATGNYQLSTPRCNEGEFDKYPGAVGVTVYAP